MKDLKKVFAINTAINELASKAVSYLSPGIAKLLVDSNKYIDMSKNLVPGSESDTKRQMDITDKQTAIEMLKDINYTCKQVEGELKNLDICEHSFDQKQDYGDEGSWIHTTHFYTKLYHKSEVIDVSSLLIPYTDEILTSTVNHIDYMQSEISAYNMCERLGIKKAVLSKVFYTSDMSHWTKGMIPYSHFVKYRGAEYTDKQVLELIEAYKIAKDEQYIKDDEIVNYPEYTAYVDFLNEPYVLYTPN